MAKLVLALTGRPYAGSSEIAHAFHGLEGIEVFEARTAVESAAADHHRHLYHKTPREYADFEEWYRRLSGNATFLVDRALASNADVSIIDGLTNVLEARKLERSGGVIVRTWSPMDIRFERARLRDGYRAPATEAQFRVDEAALYNGNNIFRPNVGIVSDMATQEIDTHALTIAMARAELGHIIKRELHDRGL